MGYKTTAVGQQGVAAHQEYATLTMALVAVKVALESGYAVAITPPECQVSIELDGFLVKPKGEAEA